jgi:hypothetical protein
VNKLEKQLEHLNLQAELNIAKKRRGQVCGNSGSGYSVCQCSSENFINYSDHPFHTRAAFVSTWLIGFNAAEINKDFYYKYNFLRLISHAIMDNCCPSWIISPRLSKKTFYDYALMWSCFEEALINYKDECSNHKEMYLGMTECIKRMEDEDARGSLKAAMDYVFRDD